MKRMIVSLIAMAIGAYCYAQVQRTGVYRESEPITNDILHTRLKIRFNYEKAQANGTAWLTLQPHFYATSQAEIDAQGMEIHKVALVKGNALAPLKYSYDNAVLTVRLDKEYQSSEKYTICIDYTAKPNELRTKDGRPVLSKGLHFINPTGKEEGKPTQVWTHGEPEATSAWCPTIDKPNQRSTQEMYITVPQRYVTLSNGILVQSTNNADKTRTDYWKMDIPHAPYLFFVGAGEYAIVKDSYKGKEVSYYVEKPYAATAKRIFGNTPEMMAYFSRITGLPFPWQKYSQIAVRDFLSGGMENTTAVVYRDNIQQTARELADGNRFENLIAHELFHQWFGNYVTAESWSNLALNESFATYAEMLWQEYKYGKDKADELNYNGLLNYVYGRNEKKELIRFYYDDKEDLFDGITYNKGARILHMLRTYVGDSAFFKSLNLFLVQHKLRAAEVHGLRLAFEEVTGKDLNWFFNQWFLGAGHPKTEISYAYNDTLKQLAITVKQVQGGSAFRLPLVTDVYAGGKKTRHTLQLTQKEQVFTLAVASRPELVNVDADKTLVWMKKDNRDLASFIYQYKYAGNYVDRREAIDACADMPNDPRAVELFKTALNDKFDGIVFHTLMVLDDRNAALTQAVEPRLAELAKSSKAPNVRRRAIQLLANFNKPDYVSIYRAAANDSSYEVSGEALEALMKFDAPEATCLARLYSKQTLKGRLSDVVTGILMRTGSDEDFEFLAGNYDKMPISQQKMNMLPAFADCLTKVDNTARLKKGIDIITKFRDEIPEPYKKQADKMIGDVLQGLADKKRAALANTKSAEIEAQINYITERIQPKPAPVSGGTK
jgi:aminopeptidase N